MLQIIDSLLPKTCSLEIDDYATIVFKCRDTHSSMPIYWRTGNFKKSLIEVGMNPDTGAICCIKIPGIENAQKSEVQWEPGTKNLIEGIPICNVKDWVTDDNFSNRFRDELFDFKTVIGMDFVSFLLAPIVEAHSIYQVGQLCIGVDKSRTICKIEFNRLSKIEIERIVPASL